MFLAPLPERRRNRTTGLFRLLTLSAVVLACLGASAQARCVDLALVLAIDASGSINPHEFTLQQQGYASAFRSAEVKSTLALAGEVDVAVVLWGDTEMSPQILPWRNVRSAEDADMLAQDIAAMPRIVTGHTGIGRAISESTALLQAPGRCALRKVINVSGDGIETADPRARLHVPLATARSRAEDLDIVINGLAIQTDEPALADWYRDRVIAGPGAFVLAVSGFDTFPEAIRKKLVREIMAPRLAAAGR